MNDASDWPVDPEQGPRAYPRPKAASRSTSTVHLPGIFPRDYQQEAIEAWWRNGRRGVLDMATGTGKTIVALEALARCSDAGFVVIGVPTNALVTQWLEELRKLEGIHPPVEISGRNRGWSEKLLPRLRLAAAADDHRDRPFVFVGTYASLSGARFRSILDRVPPAEGRGLLIGDEAHHLGAPTYRRLLQPHFSFRLGLTATLERSYDPQGTQTVEAYFGGTVYELRIEDVVGNVLCNYRYDVHFAELDEDEFKDYRRLSFRIACLIGEGEETEKPPLGDSDLLTNLLLRRARIVKLARAKLELLGQLARQLPISKCLVYCADLEQVRAAQSVLSAAGVLHLPYTSRQSSHARRAALRQLRRDEIQAVVAIKCLDEGIDVPQVHQAILLASSTSERQFVQRRGRILRQAEDKAYAHLVDVFTVPPRRYHDQPPRLLLNELRRARRLARAAHNRFQAENRLHEELSRFGIPIERTLGVRHAGQ